MTADALAANVAGWSVAKASIMQDELILVVMSKDFNYLHHLISIEK